MKPVSLTSANFDSTIAKGTVLVDFWAEWCGPCRQQLAVLERVAPQVPEGVTIAKVNVDEERELAARFQIRSIPALLLFQDGKLVKTVNGLTPDNRLLEWLTPVAR